MSTLEILERIPFLKGTDFASVLGSIERIPATVGDVVFQSGDLADAGYVIESGAVQIVLVTPDGAELVTARLEAGDHFGEQAFLVDTRRRGATVRVVDAGVLLRIPGEVLLTLLKGSRQGRDELAALGKVQRARDFARQSVLFKNLPLEVFSQLALDHSDFQPGEIVFNEGDHGDRVFLILSGRAAVYKDRDGSPTLVALIEAGQCFGEMAVTGKTLRSATIRAEGTLRTLSVDAASFAQMLAGAPQIQQYMTTLQRIYQLPKRGFVTQGTGRLQGEDATTCVYRLPDGTTVVAARTIDGRVFSMKRGGEDVAAETFRYSAPDQETVVELGISGDRLQSVTISGEWPSLGKACEAILQNDPFDRWRATVFATTGRMELEAAPKFGGADEMFCTCMQIKLGRVREVITEGASDAETIVRKTGCGTVCGSCRPRLGDLLGQGSWCPVKIAEVIPHTSDIAGFRLKPWTGALEKPAVAGQHIVLEGLIDGAWIRRSYTLTSHPEERGYREVIVKREQHGLFSSWLLNENHSHTLLRISEPQGDAVLGGDEGPVICLVAGIGVTPGIVMFRALAGANRRVYVDYTVRDARDAICLDEFRAIEADNELMTFRLRVTSRDGRLQLAELLRLKQELPGATYFVCGPSSYDKAMGKLLEEAGVPAENVKVERFTHAGGPVKANPLQVREKTKPTLPAVKPAVFPYKPVRQTDEVGMFAEAKEFLTQVFYETGVLDALPHRLAEVEREIEQTGTYVHTFDELAYGTKIAWRNSNQCVGRMFWPAMQIRDCRHLLDEKEIADSFVEHLRVATNGGRIRCLTTFFHPSRVRIWNAQIVRYAGYRQPDGSIIGDPYQVEFTEKAMAMGWTGAGTPFDVLPLIIQVDDRPPKLFVMPEDAVLQVPIVHPKFRWFEELKLKWHAVPVATDHGFDLGGIRYQCMPFGGWYMSAEIASRNLCDSFRYDMIPAVAERMGLDMSQESTLWRDKALVEMNVAVLHSYARMGVTLLDHHTATRKFMEYVREERGRGRDVETNWAWTVPPISGSLSPVFHVEFSNVQYKPMLYRLGDFWQGRPVS